MKIFITGIAGFLGSHLAKRLEKLGHEISGNDTLIGGELSNLAQFNPEVQQLKIAKIKRAKELFKEGYQKTKILRIIIKEFKLERDLNSRSWPKWLSEI